MKKKNLSTVAKRRLGRTKKERSAKMRKLALLKHAGMTPAQESKHGKQMRKARGKMTHFKKITL